jgi:undecaprenol kinase
MQKMKGSFLCAWNGLKTVWKEEQNFRIETITAVAVTISIFYFDFSLIEAILLMIPVVFVLTAEIVNTTIEDLCDKVQPEFDSAIGKIKDTMAAFVLVSVFGSILIGVLVFANHFL